MGLPWRTFSQSVTTIELFTSSKITTTNIGVAYNIAYREIVEAKQWSARKAEVVVNTVDPYSTGTVAITQGDATVTLTGGTFTSAMVGRYIRIADSDTFYRLITFTDATHMEIEVNWPYTAETAASYEVFQYLYTVDTSAGEVGQILLPSDDWAIEEKSLYWVTMRDPARRSTGGLARAYILHGLNSTNAQAIEFWPRYSAATSVRIPYYKRVDDISGTSQPIINAAVIEALALSYCYSSLISKFGAPEYVGERDHWEQVFKARLEAALEDDFERHNTPRAVQDQHRGSLDWDYLTRHDL
jgi:hypothetical protein